MEICFSVASVVILFYCNVLISNMSKHLFTYLVFTYLSGYFFTLFVYFYPMLSCVIAHINDNKLEAKDTNHTFFLK